MLPILGVRHGKKDTTLAYTLGAQTGKSNSMIAIFGKVRLVFRLVRSKPNIGQALRNLRIHAGLTLEEAGVIGEVSPTYLSRVETGKSDPSDVWVSTVLDALSNTIRSNRSRKDIDSATELGMSA